MDRLRAMQVFQRVVERGSFRAASQDFGLSHGAASAIVRELEDHLGVPLLIRTTRSLRPTEEGLRYLAGSGAILSELDALEEDIAGSARAPRGVLRVQMPVGLVRLVVAPALAEFSARHPDLRIEVLSRNGLPDFQRDRLDAAIFIGDVPDRDLIRQTLGRVPLRTLVSPAYRAARGVPRTPEDLAGHDCLALLSATTGQQLDWRFVRDGQTLLVPVRARLVFDASEPAVAAAVAGAGVMQMIAYLVADDIAAGRLEPIMADWLYPGHDICLLTQRLAHKPRKLVVFEAFLRQLLRDYGRRWGMG